ncbi:MAG TPA: hypothetical protein VNN17_06850 [Terriglobia bacterium]|nr:hypothetical protein [Terriglobia bacterium]
MERDSLVIVSLNEPKEKMWGRLLSLDAAGATIQGIDLNSFDDWLRQVVESEPGLHRMSTVFYPMHRIERIALDEPAGEIPSIGQRFEQRLGMSLLEYLEAPHKP